MEKKVVGLVRAAISHDGCRARRGGRVVLGHRGLRWLPLAPVTGSGPLRRCPGPANRSRRAVKRAATGEIAVSVGPESE